MAAKVVMVAVPTVLGIASIRVYTVSEAPTDGLFTREKLNVYTPLPNSAHVQFVPARPGVVESGLTTVRESLLPFVQAVKGACVSVKRGSVNVYHGGEDVFYYLKDPPPGFLPRFGTITMAGLLGMFLARKGSRFKRLAVPLGLMTAGASVCYPAQAVTVFKVTGRKAKAAAQWSSAAVSSLLTSKNQEHVAKEISASEPQVAPVPNPETADVEEARSSEPGSTTDTSAKNTAISETDVESAESVAVSDEPIISVITEEASVTLTDLSAVQAPAETHTDRDVHSVPADTETDPPAEESPAAAESEEPSAPKQASEDVSTEVRPPEPTVSLEPETGESVQVEIPASTEEPPAPTEEPPALLTSQGPSVASVYVAEAPADMSSVAAVEEDSNPTQTPPPPEQPAAEHTKEGSAFKPDPALMDFGQSSPEDEDLYSTRS